MPLYALDGISPQIEDDARKWIAPDAQVIGNVSIGIDVGIWFGAVLRGDNDPIVIGAGTNIQDGVMVHTDPGKGVTIGEGVFIEGKPWINVRLPDGRIGYVQGSAVCTLTENASVRVGLCSP